VLTKVRAPFAQGEGVVLTQVLGMTDIQAVVLHRGDDPARSSEFAVREHISIDETPALTRPEFMGRVMQWFSNRPPGRSLLRRKAK
jgi:hypothetical protein